MNDLELVTFIRFKDERPHEVIEHHSDVCDETHLDDMRKKFEAIEHTMFELKEAGVFNEEVLEINGIITHYTQEDETKEVDGDILAEFSVMFD